MADNSSNSNGSSFLASLSSVLAILAVFAILVILAYGLSNDEVATVAPGDPPPSGASLMAKDTETLTSYGWVDQEKGIVRIPVDRAKDLVIQELNQ